MTVVEKIGLFLKENLGLEDINHDIPLYDYGVNSLMLIELVVLIREDGGDDILLSDLKNPTIRTIAEYANKG